MALWKPLTADNLPTNIFSNILEKVDSSFIGRYDETRLSGLPGFGSIAITAHFHGVGKWWMRTMELKSSNKNITPFSGQTSSAVNAIIARDLSGLKPAYL
ncbi:GH23443 [Drosophila grimshawi]|uniref:GH23443 n=1 Tax=Drosophila grimshawi TaxID=7222 RepID=B4K1A8_DROGR|nr:GH23443 [Drosophila grimshawi]